jgi:aldose 1-epimerase
MSGEQLEITKSGARAVVTLVGAGLRAYEVDGVAYTETYGPDEEPPKGAGAVLVPWPNRVAGACWRYHGTPLELEVTEPARGNAIHGLVRHDTWTVTEHTGSRVSLEVSVDGRPGYPFPFRTTISYELGDTGLTVTHGMVNNGTETMPFGVGTHPYVRPGRDPIEDAELCLAATTMLPLDKDSMVPTGPPVDIRGTELDFRGGKPAGTVDLDHAFGGCEVQDGLVRHSLGGVEVWADESFRWVQVFTPRDFPDGLAVAIEPMTCPPDALNSGVDLIRLAPGASWTGRWGIMPK